MVVKKKKKVSQPGAHMDAVQSRPIFQEGKYFEASMPMSRAVPIGGLTLEPFPEHSLLLQLPKPALKSIELCR